MNPHQKRKQRNRRSLKTRAKIRQLKIPRLCINKSLNHIYAQVIIPNQSNNSDHVLVQASSLESAVQSGNKAGKVETAKAVGKLVAERAKSSGVTKVAFDRSGFKYHGRIKALADSAREGGLEI
jgi:large subunit ribosomal protein L18